MRAAFRAGRSMSQKAPMGSPSPPDVRSLSPMRPGHDSGILPSYRIRAWSAVELLKNWLGYLGAALSHRDLPEDPLAGGKKYPSLKANLRNLFPFFLRHWKMGAAGAGLIVFNGLLAFPQPLISRFLIDDVILGHRLLLLAPVVLLVLAVALIGRLAGMLQQYILTVYHQELSLDIQEALLARTLRYPKAFFDRNQTGYLMTRLAGAVGAVRVCDGPRAGRGTGVSPGTPLRGRALGAAVPLHDADVSRRHAAVEVTAWGAATVSDLGSTNGIFVDGVRLPVAERRAASGRLVDDRPARNIDEVRGLFHHRELRRADEVPRLVVEQRNRDDEIGLPQQRFHRKLARADVGELDGIDVRVCGEQLHVEHARQPQQLTAHAPRAAATAMHKGSHSGHILTGSSNRDDRGSLQRIAAIQ